VALSYQLLGHALPGPDHVVSFIQSRRREDGGFVEIAPMKRSGTNPTAAAVGVLQILGAVDAVPRSGIIDFLAGMATDEGGLKANARAPLADLLSTFTGIWSLNQLDAQGRVNLQEARNFVSLLEFPDGGFRGGLWDNATDVEYTFYGLGCWGITT
jgi:geranylgeranyl transferase type-2 subunit beta